MINPWPPDPANLISKRSAIVIQDLLLKDKIYFYKNIIITKKE
jgi:hypothetical protein